MWGTVYGAEGAPRAVTWKVGRPLAGSGESAGLLGARQHERMRNSEHRLEGRQSLILQDPHAGCQGGTLDPGHWGTTECLGAGECPKSLQGVRAHHSLRLRCNKVWSAAPAPLISRGTRFHPLVPWEHLPSAR